MRRDLWQVLRYTLYGQQPWTIMGTSILYWTVGESLEIRVDRNAIKEFKDWIQRMDILKIHSKGFEFTWSNKTDETNRIYIRIDHMFCNDKWNSKFPNFQVNMKLHQSQITPLTFSFSREVKT